MSDEQVKWFATESFVGAMMSGGLLHYLYSPNADWFDIVPQAFTALGLEEYAELVENIKSTIPPSLLTRYGSRIQVLAHLSECERVQLEQAQHPFWTFYNDPRSGGRSLIDNASCSFLRAHYGSFYLGQQ